MKINKKMILIVCLVVILSIAGFFLMNSNKSNENSNTQNTEVPIYNNSNKSEENDLNPKLEFFKAITGLKSNKTEIINNPLAIKGELVAPKDTILNGVDYFLKKMDNKNFEKISLNLGEDSVKIKSTYKVNDKIKTPIEITIIPSLTKSKDLILNIEEVKFLDLKVFKWIVNLSVDSIIKDLLPEEKGMKITFKDGSVIVDKSNFKQITINKLKITEEELKLDVLVNLDKIIKE